MVVGRRPEVERIDEIEAGLQPGKMADGNREERA
jgi:hypothetical protein